jgi:hypothetical protein
MPGCTKTGLYSGWNKRKSGIGGVQETYMKMNFRLGQNTLRAGQDDILKCRRLQGSTLGVHL